MSRRGLLALLTLAVASACIASPARGDFSPFSLVSGTATLQADYAYEPAISGDGSHIAFVGSIAGQFGVWWRNLATGETRLVAAGTPPQTTSQVPSVGAPSISADGRYVSFTSSNADLVSGTGSQCSSVWRRDMSVFPLTEANAAGAFTLVSAGNGSTSPLTYAGSNSPGCPGGGSSAPARVAMSADGNEVAFTVVGCSNLAASTSDCINGTPPDQIAVRNIAAGATTLVSQTMASLGATGPLGSSTGPQPVPGGAAITDQSTQPAAGPPTANADPGDSTASISADGSTVAWLGINIPMQAPASSIDSYNSPLSAPSAPPDEYDEPLWRQWAAGPTSPIRRVLCDETTGHDPTGGCNGPLSVQFDAWDSIFGNGPGGNPGPDRGSFNQLEGFRALAGPLIPAADLDSATPQLSADGQIVAVASTQPDLGETPCLALGTQCTALGGDAYVVNMAPGLTRFQAVTRITKWASENVGDVQLAGPINGIAISPEGDRVAFVTTRTVFPFSPPALVTPQLAMVPNEQLYVADLGDGTLELVSAGYDREPANGEVVSPTFSPNDGPLVFASSATNLVFGAEAQAAGETELFETLEIKPPAVPGVQQIGPPPLSPQPAPEWRIGTTVGRAADGSLLLDVSVPGAGSVSAIAVAGIPTSPAARSNERRDRRQPSARRRPTRRAFDAHSARATGRRRRGARRRRGSATVVVRTIATAATIAGGPGVVELELVPAAAYRSVIATANGLYSTVTVRFAAAAEPPLTETIPVDFIARLTAHASRARVRSA
jgi:hypothetical protein